MATQTPTPIDTTLPGAYQGQQIDAEAAYQTALQNIATQQAQAMQSYGFTAQVDPTTGALQNETIDPNDQYSQVMNLLNTHAGAMQTLRNGLLGRGLGNSGLSAQQQALLKFTQAGETSNLGNQFSQQMNTLYGQQNDALTTRNQAFTTAEQNALQYQIQNQLFDAVQSQNSAAANPATTNGAGTITAGPTAPTGFMNTITNGMTPTSTTSYNPTGSVIQPNISTAASTLAKTFAQPTTISQSSNSKTVNPSGYSSGSGSNLH